jgi:hypothetical protein
MDIPPRGTICEMSMHQAEGNRDLEIATCPAKHPETPQPLQSRFLNRGSCPKLADFTKPDARQYRGFSPALICTPEFLTTPES